MEPTKASSRSVTGIIAARPKRIENLVKFQGFTYEQAEKEIDKFDKVQKNNKIGIIMIKEKISIVFHPIFQFILLFIMIQYLGFIKIGLDYTFWILIIDILLVIHFFIWIYLIKIDISHNNRIKTNFGFPL